MGWLNVFFISREMDQISCIYNLHLPIKVGVN